MFNPRCEFGRACATVVLEEGISFIVLTAKLEMANDVRYTYGGNHTQLPTNMAGRIIRSDLSDRSKRVLYLAYMLECPAPILHLAGLSVEGRRRLASVYAPVSYTHRVPSARKLIAGRNISLPSKAPFNTFHNAITEHRVKMGVTVTHLAERVGYSRRHFDKLMHLSHGFKLDICSVLADLMHLDVDQDHDLVHCYFESTDVPVVTLPVFEEVVDLLLEEHAK